MLMIGSNIAHARLERKMTQAQLAGQCGIPQPNLSNIEKGKKDLMVFTLIRIASALGVSPAQLLDEGTVEKHGLELTRENIELLAEVIVNPDRKATAEIREHAELFREIFSETHSRKSAKQIQFAWSQLKNRFTSQEIRGIERRVQDARQRKQ